MTTTAIQERDEALARVQQRDEFNQRAAEHMLLCLRFGQMSGEEMVNQCLISGIRPVANETRAFGPVIMSLARAGKITKAGYCQRNKGHGCSGGNIWALSK